MERIMGLDVGDKTIGVAISDLLQMTAQGVTTIRRESKEKDFGALLDLITQYEIKRVVVGLPKNMNNSEGEAVLRTRKFIRLLKDNFNIDIVEQDERLSSVTANSVLLKADLSRKKRKEKVDAVAATIILQNYLDIRKGA